MKGFDAVDAGQLDVHQDERRMSLVREAHALFAGLGLDGLITLDLQRISHQLQVLGLSSTMRMSSFAMTHRDRERERRARA